MCQDARISPSSSGSAFPGTFTGQGDTGDGQRHSKPKQVVPLVSSSVLQTEFRGGGGGRCSRLRQQLKLAAGFG